jgi:putative zinc finger protein
VTCTEFLALLDELIDETVTVETRSQMHEHLSGCDHCEVTIRTTKKTIDIYRSHELYELPNPVRERLHAAIMARCKHGC